MPKLTINGKEIEVADGTRVIEAAKQIGVDVPFYCYHPGLSIAGNCRMCLVEIEKMPKLAIACHTVVQEGMVVKTNTERVESTRKHVLEFLLLNHPVDCPVCDQAGECWLQDYYMNYGAYASRLAEDKVQKPKAVSVGPTVMLDAERCILCSRCVRFTDEISKTQELGIVNRGDHSEVQVFPGKELNNPYAGNVVDICPVGALTDKDFRFKIRVWYLKSRDSICNGCSRGCNTSVQYNLDRPHHGKGERVKRIKPRYNENVNQWWMCDEGRYGYKFHDQNRITGALKCHGGEAKALSWEEILGEAAADLIKAQGKIGVLISPQSSNEEIFLASKLFKEHLKAGQMALLSPNEDGFQDDILIRADKNPNSKGAQELGFQYDQAAVEAVLRQAAEGALEGLVVFGQDLAERLKAGDVQAALAKVKWSLFIGSNLNSMAEHATYVLPAATYIETEGTFTNFEGRTQKFDKVLEPLGDSRPVWEILKDLADRTALSMPYESPADIFDALIKEFSFFAGLSYDELDRQGNTDIRVTSAPTVPALEQHSGLIFHEHAEESKDIRD